MLRAMAGAIGAPWLRWKGCNTYGRDPAAGGDGAGRTGARPQCCPEHGGGASCGEYEMALLPPQR